MREQIETQFGFEIMLARTEVGGYCAHCQILREREMAEAAKGPRLAARPPAPSRGAHSRGH
jgi:Fur family ferric uptake transcriptional regulator